MLMRGAVLAPTTSAHRQLYPRQPDVDAGAHRFPSGNLGVYAILKSFKDDFILPANCGSGRCGSIFCFPVAVARQFAVRSGSYALCSRFFWILVPRIVLDYVEAVHQSVNVALGQLATAYYFAHFLILLPLLSRNEETLPLPSSISASVLHGELQESAPIGTTKTAAAAAE